MKTQWAMRSVLIAGWLVFAGNGSVFAETSTAEPTAWSGLAGESSSAWSRIPPVREQQVDLFRQTPTLSGRMRVSEQTLIPYVGAGFGGGYVTERDRALNPMPVLPQQNLLGDSLGKGMMPNEFQMGIRIPF